MQQYDRYDRLELFGKDIHIHGGDQTFTRPLLNRDWQVRLRGNDVANSGLLVTGRYGAGKVAVFASSATVPTAAVWEPLLKWLDADRPSATDCCPEKIRQFKLVERASIRLTARCW